MNSLTIEASVEAAARRLREAADTGTPCPPVRTDVSDIGSAYAVQRLNVTARVEQGARVVGRKIGLTNPVVQAQLGVDQPDFGALLDDMQYPSGSLIDIGRTLQPRIEAEIAFVLKSDLVGPQIDSADVAAATDYVVAALEIVDSRIAGWDITLLDTVADNASAGLYVLGDEHVALTGLDLEQCEMAMRLNDHIVSVGSGADCLGNPLIAVAWLANTLRDFGEPLRAGDVVLSGALGPVAAVTPGSSFTAEVTGVGRVTARFSEVRLSEEPAS